MAVRFTSSATSGDSAAWTPTDESVIQLDAADNGTIVEVLGRVSASRKWVRLGVLNANLPDQQFLRLPQMPFMMASIVRNANAGAFVVEDNL